MTVYWTQSACYAAETATNKREIHTVINNKHKILHHVGTWSLAAHSRFTQLKFYKSALSFKRVYICRRCKCAALGFHKVNV